MARVLKTVKLCDRCAFGKERDATTTRKYAIDGEAYKIDLCEQHGQMFDREMMGWIRLSTEDEFASALRGVQRSNAFFTEDELERQRRAGALRDEQHRHDEEVRLAHEAELERQREEDKWNDKVSEIKAAQMARRNPLELKWVLTDHARMRILEREYEIDEVLEAAEHPEETFPGDRLRHGTDSRVHRLGRNNVVVIPDRKIIVTVLPKEARLFRPKDLSNTQLERIAQ